MSLDFQQHSECPTFHTEGSPVQAPKGRDSFEDGGKIPFVKLDFPLMTQACKFAFFQASRTKKHWNKASTKCYLKYCGINPTLGGLLYDVARLAAKEKQQDATAYDSPVCIGSFDFPAAWFGDLSLFDFIETVMHMLALGIAESNLDLMTKWLSNLPARSKLSSSVFRRAVQPLLVDLKPFMLQWLQAHPFNGDKGELKTGGWVGDNWMCMTRTSKCAFGWCARDYETASKCGVDDMSRMVTTFHGLVARCLTHSGIDEDFVAESELHMKEFLSCVREFDIRVCHKELNKATGPLRGWQQRPGGQSPTTCLWAT